MYSKRHNLIIGFHGCDLHVRNNIVNHQEDQYISGNGWDWLGHGFYFWEYNLKRAIDYAERLKKNPIGKANIKEPAALGAIIDLGHCIDLLDSAYLLMVKTAYERLQETYTKSGFSMPINKNPISGESGLLIRNLDCAVIQALHKYHKEENDELFDSVRNVFVEGDPLYNNSGFHEKNHIQICVRNINCIKGYFIPRENNENWESLFNC